MKTIIVATDFSKGSENALRYASFIARFTRADIALLNVYYLSTHAMNGLISPAAIDELLTKNKQRLDKYAEEAASRYNVKIATYSQTGILEEVAAELAKKLDAGLLVMGMHGASVEDKILGNTCTSAINNVRIPVLVVPEKVEFKIPEKMLFACDYHTIPASQELATLNEIVRAFGAELQIFHVGKTEDTVAVQANVQTEMIQALEHSFENVKRSYRDVEADDIMQGIEEGVKEFGADILVMAPHSYGFWSSIFHRSRTCAMTFRINIPLLSIPY